MSAYVIDSATMGRALRGLFARNSYGQIIPQFAGHYTGDRRSGAATEVGRKLFAMNIEAVMQRYPDCRQSGDLPGPKGAASLADKYVAPDFGMGATHEVRALVHFYKAIGALIYQCSEGNIPETELYRELTAAAGELAGAIIRMLPEYERAAW